MFTIIFHFKVKGIFSMNTSVIIVSAGSSTRMNGTDKQFAEICGIPVIVRSMLAFEKSKSVAEIIVASRPECIDRITGLATEYNITKLTAVVSGGKTRQESVFNAVRKISETTELIAVHDGARPLVETEHIEKVIRDAVTFGGAVLGVPVKDTIKVVSGGLVTDTPPRSSLYITQTPQVFKKSVYFRGVEFAERNYLDFTDDCQLAEAIGVKICMTEGAYTNIKITTPEDLLSAEIFVRERNKKCSE